MDQYVSFDSKLFIDKFDKEVKNSGGRNMNIDDLIREDYLKKLEKEKREAIAKEREKVAKEKEKARKKELEIARNLKKAGVDIQLITNSTGLSIEDIEKL